MTSLGAGGGDDEWHLRARADVDMDPEALTDHYVAELEAHGWTTLERLTGRSAAVATFAFEDDEGSAWTGIFTTLADGGAAVRHLSLEIRRPGAFR